MFTIADVFETQDYLIKQGNTYNSFLKLKNIFYSWSLEPNFYPIPKLPLLGHRVLPNCLKTSDQIIFPEFIDKELKPSLEQLLLEVMQLEVD